MQNEDNSIKTINTKQPSSIFIKGIEIPTYQKVFGIWQEIDHEIKKTQIGLKIISFLCFFQSAALVMVALGQLR